MDQNKSHAHVDCAAGRDICLDYLKVGPHQRALLLMHLRFDIKNVHAPEQEIPQSVAIEWAPHVCACVIRPPPGVCCS